MVIIAVENSLAQHLHINSQIMSPSELLDTNAWTIRVAGEFMIIMNNLMSFPVIVRHPQRFNDSRSFMTAFKREFLQLLEISPIPHAKIRMIRDAQFGKVAFTRQIQPETQQQLQKYQNLMIGPNSIIDWEKNPSNAEIALQLAEQTQIINQATDEEYVVMDIFEDYSITDFKVPSHPELNEHNRRYLYRSLSINDIMNATAVGEKILDDYEEYLEERNKSESIIDRDLDCAADYIGYCEALGESVLDDLTLIYHYFINYEKLHNERPTDTGFRSKSDAFREFGKFLRAEDLFSSEDYDKFVQAVNQGIKDLNSKQRMYHLQRIIRDMQRQVRNQREHAIQYVNKQYTIYVELSNYNPKMWRRFTVSGDTRLDMLCFTILAAFNADGNHLFELQQGSVRYQLPIFDSGFGQTKDITQSWVGDCDVSHDFHLIYDFGDMWDFKIKFEEIKPKRIPAHTGPEIIDGFGYGILEDIGGVTGLAQVAKDDGSINSQLNITEFKKKWARQIEKIHNCYE
ncbi:plasmid pRiA4b ORF-3 family protein [Limosilactobacillus albertensis]|uniref:plasmid pRiA4b ORF-3 family protein n=1 Tax=Limosilactobacillus albertensis TaxID=2759752 RepID=UPI001C7289B9|nr:plasmid pRiA4b ORF-3 family protein [Limosilactobacillus albertensis]MCD7121536.1 plasmid pRiA4b ORF-3 family protein [Limosilactobacillus albertensis]